MAASLPVTPLSLKAVAASYILSLAVCIPVSGWTADRYGTRRAFALAAAVFTISSVFCGLAINVRQMVAARILQGIGVAMTMPVGRLTVIRTFPKAEQLQAMNFVITPAYAVRLKYLRMRPSHVRSLYLQPAASVDYNRLVRRAGF
jgi:MFS family permease